MIDPICRRMEEPGENFPMRQVKDHLIVATDGQRLYEITDRVRAWVSAQDIAQGLLTLYLHHTSASLLIQENADPDVLH
ncbi:MAG: YjbQ family protein, partial [Gammaproteobacteria bacterium]